jgi:hypothetical protein
MCSLEGREVAVSEEDLKWTLSLGTEGAMG